MDKNNGYLGLVLHAHLPYVNHPDFNKFLEEDWLFEALSEVYIPIFDMIDRLWKNYQIKSNITISISPPLIAMLSNKKLMAKFEKYVVDRVFFLEEELERYGNSESNYQLKKIALYYKDYYENILTIFNGKMAKQPLQFIVTLEKDGLFQAITTSATHTFLPNFIPYQKYINLQERLGLYSFKETFGKDSEGFWLPECGYYPGIEKELQKRGVKYTFLEFHGLLLGNPMPVYGAYSPIYNRRNFMFFARDLDSAKQVWSREIGYPADENYRDFYKDVGFEWDTYYTSKILHKDKNGNPLKGMTGLKYWSIKSKHGTHQFYNPNKAREMAVAHARDFWNKIADKTSNLRPKMNKPPIIIAPYDMELFGHWWFEGPIFIEELIKLSAKSENLSMTTISDYVSNYTKHQVVEPVYSSWGENGFSLVWNNDKNQDIIVDSSKIIEQFLDNLDDFIKNAKKSIIFKRALFQLVREIILMTSSDWPFLINSNVGEYAYNRFNEHKENSELLLGMLNTNSINELQLIYLEEKNSIIVDMDLSLLENL